MKKNRIKKINAAINVEKNKNTKIRDSKYNQYSVNLSQQIIKFNMCKIKIFEIN